MDRQPIVIAGAGLSGAVLARQLAEAGHAVTIYEQRDHIAGNCYTERDAQTGVLVHRYGPHIFHTSDREVWDYVTGFTTFRPYYHRVRTTLGGTVFPMPVTLKTINQFFAMNMTPQQAEAFVTAQAEPIEDPQTFEEQALSMIGRPLYEAFFEGYTQKQWGRPARDLPASILKRLPLRFTAEDGYFNHAYQGMPEDGYTPLVAAILDHPDITVHLSTPCNPAAVSPDAHLFWSGPLDAYFGHALGRLGYRTLEFTHSRQSGDFQGIAVMNYGDVDVPYTRITEHKHFAPWEDHAQTVVTHEVAAACGPDDIPYYPIRLVHEKALLSQYVATANAVSNVTFVGRLGTYRYLDMDVCIREALDTAAAYLQAQEKQQVLPAFVAQAMLPDVALRVAPQGSPEGGARA